MKKRSAFSHISRDLKASIRREILFSKALNYQPRFKRVAQLPCKLKHIYFITTDKGIFRAENDQLIEVTPWHTYGFAIHGDFAYCAITVKKWSILLKCRLKSLLVPACPEWEELYRYEAPDTNCRFHGMDVDSKYLWLAHTGKGGLLKFDLNGKQPPEQFSVFLDHFGEPIKYDHNHINGVSAYEQFTLFTAYRIGNTSGVGIIDGENITVFAVPNLGIHDAYFIGDDFYHCDTFGINQKGYLMRNNKPIDTEHFDKPPGFIVRGVSGTVDEMLLGHSHKGERKDRFKGNGSILFLRQHKVQLKLDFHGSQIYQVIRQDGVAMAPKPCQISTSKALAKLEQLFGPAVYQNKTIKQ